MPNENLAGRTIATRLVAALAVALLRRLGAEEQVTLASFSSATLRACCSCR